MSFDTHCYDLAKLFLRDLSKAKTGDVDVLAQQIQDTIESFIAVIDDDEVDDEPADEKSP